jgi:hypothetical protein
MNKHRRASLARVIRDEGFFVCAGALFIRARPDIEKVLVANLCEIFHRSVRQTVINIEFRLMKIQFSK